MKKFAFLCLEGYQKYLSPPLHTLGKLLFGSSFACRFHPTCSEYFKQALHKYSLPKALYLGLKRLLNCHQFTRRSPIDPLP